MAIETCQVKLYRHELEVIVKLLGKLSIEHFEQLGFTESEIRHLIIAYKELKQDFKL